MEPPQGVLALQGFWAGEGEFSIRVLAHREEQQMDNLEARKVLKDFGMLVTDFMGRRRELTEQAATAILGQDRQTLTQLLATLMTETSELHRRWLEVTNLVLQEEREAYSEMARLLEQAGQTERTLPEV